MNKKLNTALFMIGATVFNLLLLFALIVLAMVALTAIFGDRLGPSLMSILLIVVFLAAMVGSFLIYNQVVKFIARKIDMEKYFLPLFKRRPPKKDNP
jgi:membrane-bound acyltransferase YfiQ involved in biofilm formation